MIIPVRPTAIGEMPNLSLGKSGSVTQQHLSTLRNKLQEIIHGYNEVASAVSTAMRVFSGQRALPGQKMPGLVTHTFAVPFVAEEVSHGLGRFPQGYLVIRRYPAGAVWDGSTADWNPNTAFLTTDTAGLTVTVLFF